MKNLMKMALCAAMTAAMAASLCACGGSEAAFPSKEINMVVPFGSGGSADLLARTIAEPAGEAFGKNVVVENVTGASGTVGSAQVADADADGYNLMFVTSAPLVVQPYFMEGLTYDLDSFTPICNVASEPTCIAVLADSPYETLEDLLNADGVSLGNTGVGTLHYLFQQELFNEAGTDYKQVAFEGGAKLVTGLLGGNVDAISTVVSEMYDYVESGEIRILAVSTEERSDLYPDIPTVKECGYDFSMSLDFFIVGPANLPDDVAAALSSTFADAAQSETVTTYLANAHVSANYMDGDTLKAKLESDSEMYKSIVDATKE